MPSYCTRCNRRVGFLEQTFEGICSICIREQARHTGVYDVVNTDAAMVERSALLEALRGGAGREEIEKFPTGLIDEIAQSIIVTTTPSIPYADVDHIIDVVTAEAAIAMNIFKDIATAWRDSFGGRAKSVQGALREGRELCLRELRREAFLRKADAVIGVDLDYSEFNSANASGSMLFVVASGTAVKLTHD